MSTTITAPAPLQNTSTRRRTLRSIGAVVIGLVVIAALSSITDVVLSAMGIYPPVGTPLREPALYLVALGYRTAYSIFGCWLAARLAPSSPMRHALVLGAIGVVLSIGGVIANIAAQLGPNWYPIALVVVALPCAWVGGRLHRAR